MIKQVIVMRTDLGMRRGKQIAQGAHAAMAFLSAYLRDDTDDLTDAAVEWLNGGFTKICVGIGSEAELVALVELCKAEGLTTHLITDSGLTEFHHVPTITCAAIGPNEAAKIDQFTGSLKLL